MKKYYVTIPAGKDIIQLRFGDPDRENKFVCELCRISVEEARKHAQALTRAYDLSIGHAFPDWSGIGGGSHHEKGVQQHNSGGR